MLLPHPADPCALTSRPPPTQFYVPYLLHKEGMGHRVEGELYAVDDAVLAKLDE